MAWRSISHRNAQVSSVSSPILSVRLAYGLDRDWSGAIFQFAARNLDLVGQCLIEAGFGIVDWAEGALASSSTGGSPSLTRQRAASIWYRPS